MTFQHQEIVCDILIIINELPIINFICLQGCLIDRVLLFFLILIMNLKVCHIKLKLAGDPATRN